MPPRRTCASCWVLPALLLLALVSCRQASSELYGWRARTPGVELYSEKEPGPGGQPVLGLLYTIATGQDYAIELPAPSGGWEGCPALHMWGKATRVLHLALVLVDEEGIEHRSTQTLLTGDWSELSFDAFEPPLENCRQVTLLRLVDLTGGLGGQGPVSLKLVGLAFEAASR